MIKFISFGSGSCGNCYYIGDGEKKGVLVDAGLSYRTVKPELARYGLTNESFSAILVTHDHLDHIRGLRSFCKNTHKPVYGTARMHSSLAFRSFTRDFIISYRKFLNDGITEIGGIKVRWFEVPHDATHCVGFQLDFDGYKFFIMTDVGYVTDEAVEIARESDTVVIESNYDYDWLMDDSRCSYPIELKNRIANEGHGHISNAECAEALKRIWHPGLEHIFLCHLSENSNDAPTAMECSRKALAQVQGISESEVTNLDCLLRHVVTGPFILGANHPADKIHLDGNLVADPISPDGNHIVTEPGVNEEDKHKIK